MKLAFALALCTLQAALAGEINLSGRWGFRLDPQDAGLTSQYWTEHFKDTIDLPGTTSEAHKGEPLNFQPSLPPLSTENLDFQRGLMFGRPKDYTNENTSLMHLVSRFSYLGPAWYRRTVDIPASWADKDVQLILERALWETRLWVNGHFIGAQNSLVTPHQYEIAAALKPGRNEIILRVDNRRQLAIGNPHAYTQESQTIWNGIIGRIALVAQDKIRIDRLDIRPDLQNRRVKVTVATHNGSGHACELQLHLRAVPFPALNSPISIPSGDSEQTFSYPLTADAELWSEFDPKLYKMQARLEGVGVESETSAEFGLREFRSNGQRFTINGQPTFLRGTVECCVFPKTGYPDMTGKKWKKMFAIVKACGLNHVRFHTWCPPEIAFELADRAGIYLEVELPDWSFQIGKDPAVTDFFREEGERMIKQYGNHPSWVMLTMGNELKGDYHALDDLVAHFRELDPALLFASTTYPSSKRGKVPGVLDDYYISQDTQLGRVRGQGLFNDSPPDTTGNFDHAASCIKVPLISHEVGQYCVFPNLAEIPKYDGVLRPVAFEAIRDDLIQKGRLNEAPIYTRDSGELAVLLYKEEIERALRTTNQAGFQLLQLNDFPGQGTSTVGLFDSFWDNKGLIDPAAFRKFCGPVVPLLLMPKRTYQNDETFDATIQVANFGPRSFRPAEARWTIFDEKRKIARGSGNIHQSLAAITRASRLKITVAFPGTDIANDWSIWVYPPSEKSISANDVAIFQNAGPEFYDSLRRGKRVLLLPEEKALEKPLAVQFVPVFWNPVMFPNQPGTMGAMIDAKHPIFANFPTDPWTNWQWWELMHHGFAIDCGLFHSRVDAPLRFIDKFNRNALPAGIIEAKVGPGSLVICTLDITNDLETRIAARQLRRSILSYMSSDRFQPRSRLTESELRTVVGE
ncbi:MAG TPA: glycoside hydrolase family 2 TIM barrel-domain containing protein [Verrucomicrobiae bacterium]|jgi:hypothetical protein|nr:glycoside hydrolase family 2 TIM barrel-domain containing protein [Verrucomicrobiae bacterium]